MEKERKEAIWLEENLLPFYSFHLLRLICFLITVLSIVTLSYQIVWSRVVKKDSSGWTGSELFLFCHFKVLYGPKISADRVPEANVIVNSLMDLQVLNHVWARFTSILIQGDNMLIQTISIYDVQFLCSCLGILTDLTPLEIKTRHDANTISYICKRMTRRYHSEQLFQTLGLTCNLTTYDRIHSPIK